MTVEGDLAKSTLGVEGEFTAEGITGKLKTAVTVAPCPDPKGQFTSKTTMTASITSGGGSTGSNLTIEMEIKGQVDDDADLVSYDVDTRTQSAKFENSKGQYADQTVGWTVTGNDQGNYRGKVNRTGGAVTDQFVTDQGRWSMFTAMMMQKKAVDAAKNGWQSGRCVTLEPTTDPSKRKGLKPSTSVSISAAPRSKIDGGPVGGTVTAQLNGDTSVDPVGTKVKADAKFTYVAPAEKDKSATVALEARSKRGVAKADVVFDTKNSAYEISGTIASVPAGIKVTGKTCDVTKPFTAETSGDAIGAFTFTPADDCLRHCRVQGQGQQCPLQDVRRWQVHDRGRPGRIVVDPQLLVEVDDPHPGRRQPDAQRASVPDSYTDRSLLEIPRHILWKSTAVAGISAAWMSDPCPSLKACRSSVWPSWSGRSPDCMPSRPMRWSPSPPPIG